MRINQLQGMWRRSLIAWANGHQDTLTTVNWLQGPTFYADLRQPSLPRIKASCLRLATRKDIAALAAQEGFAGILRRHRDCFEWDRLIDYQPRALHFDRGILIDKGDMMIETGYDLPYVEHWHRDAGMPVTCAAVRMSDQASGCQGILVRAGDFFMLARDRSQPLADYPNLTESVRAAASLIAAQDLIDCELSVGLVQERWRITRSSLPWRIGMDLDPRWHGPDLLTGDLSAEGSLLERRWFIVDRDGDMEHLL